MKQKLLFLALFLCTSLMWVQKTTAQTLSAGDIAFIGYNTDDPDGFSFITLKEIPAGETIYFSEQGWSGTAWLPNAETHLQWTTSFSLSSGTIVSIIETSTDTFTVTGGGSVSIVVNSGFSLVAGDQVLAYQSSSGPAPASPIFIAGVHGDYNSTNYNSTTHWNATTVNGGSESVVPTGLINGVNCVSLFPGVAEINNAKYNGTLTGMANDIRASINNYVNWISAEPAQYDITPSAYPTPNITTVTLCALTATISSQTNVACNSGSTGSLTVTASGGTPNYTYAWSNGSTTTNTSSTTNSIIFLTAGTYSVTITDGNGCTATANATITQPTSALTATTSKTDVSCNGGSNGTASVSVSGGTPSYFYSWAPSGGTNATATGLAAGTYTCTINDVNGCQITKTITVDQPINPLTATISKTDVSCYGGTNGTASVSVSGGTPSYFYSWAPSGGTNATATGLAAGTYTCTITDANNCQITRSVTVDEPSVLSLTASSQTNIACFGGATGAAGVNAATGGAGGYTYNWTPGNPTGDGTTFVSGLTAGTWTCTVTDGNGCTASYNFTITQPTAALSLTPSSQTNIACNGEATGAASVNAATGGAGGYTYNWTPGNPTGDGTTSVSGLTAGTWTCTVTDLNGCTSSQSFTITQLPALIVNAVVNSNETCNNSNGEATASVTGGITPYTYEWSNSAVTATITDVPAGTYSVTITDANSCTATASVTILSNGITASATVDANVSCNGGSNGGATASATGGTPPYTYSWDNGVTTASIADVAAGTYTVTITDANLCSNTASVTITEPATPFEIPTAGPSIVYEETFTQNQTYCPGSSNYDNWGVFRSSIDAGATYVSITLSGSSLPGGITCNDPVAVTQIAQALRSGTNLSITVDGKAWNVVTSCFGGCAQVTDAVELNVNNSSCSCAGNATIRPCIGNSNWGGLGGSTCGASTQTMRVELVRSVVDIINVSCNGGNNGTITLDTTNMTSGVGPYTYTWSPGNPTGQGTNSISGLSAGSYDLTVTDANGCNDSQTYTVTEPAVLTASISSQTNVACNAGTTGSATVTPSGGTAPYTYLWSNTATTATVTGLAAGTYTVLITDANSCTTNTSVTITEPTAALSASVVGTDVSCNGGSNGSIDLTVTGGTAPYTYAWSNSVTTEDQAGLSAGTYNVTVTDANGCTTTASVTINEPAVLSAYISSQTNIACNGGSTGSATVTVTGGTASYTYLWSNGATTAMATGLAAGTYTVLITDANGCTATASVTITEPTAALSASGVATNVSCNGGSNGIIDLTVTGGTAPYTFAWSNTATTEDMTALAAGTYDVTVTDANGCTTTASVTVNEPTVFSASGVATNVSCNGGSNGTIDLTLTGGTAPYTYVWSNSATTEDMTGLTAGTYDVTVTDANGCTTTASVTVNEPAVLSAYISSQTNIACNGGTTGSATVTVTGGTAPYTYLWSNSASTATTTGLAAGTYIVLITDANSCTTNTSVTITQPAATLSASAIATNVSCNGDSNGSIDLTVTGGTAPYAYVWSNTATTEDMTGLTAGTYDVTVTDANGCTTTASATVTEPTAALSASGVSTNVSCNGGSNGTIDLTVTGGTAPYTFAWSNTATTEDMTGLTAGTYDVTVTDANGCTTTASVTVNEPAILSAYISSQTNIACNGGTTGSATVTVTGGTAPYTYLWSNSASTATTTGLAAGTYIVLITDANSCTTNTSVTITQPAAALSASTIATNVSCNGGSNGNIDLTVTGGTAPYAYVWSNTATTEDMTGLAAGTYDVTVTDANGCTTTASATVNQPTALTASAVTTAVSCNGDSNGTIDLTVTGGTAPYTFAWSNTATTEDMTGLSAGTYDVTVTDANGCTTTAAVIVNEPTVLSASITSLTNVACNGAATGSATVTASGGTASYEYLWSNGATTATVTGLEAGTYNVTVTDANGCSAIGTVTIDEPTSLNLTILTSNVTCNGGSNGSATATVSGGVAPYSYSWSDSGVVGANPTTLNAGTYVLTVTDSNGCTVNQTITIDEPDALTASFSSDNVSCPGSSDGTATVTVTGGTAPYEYLWSNGATTASLVGLTDGTYTVTITDDNGCTLIDSVTVVTTPDVTAPVADVATLTTVTVECSVPAGMITAPTATDNCVGAVTGTTTDPLTYTAQGTYTITWTYNDGNGNSSTQTQTVIVDDITAPVADVATLPTITVECSVPAGMITAPTATDSCVGAVTGTTTDPLTYTTQGTHTITWTYNDGNGNTSTQTQTVIVDDITAPVANVATLPTVTVECNVPAGMITAPTATDNCVGAITGTTTDPLTYTAQGTYTITWTYNDGNGNTTTQTQNVVVDDLTAPVADVTNLPEIVNYCGVMSDEIPVPTATDNCAGVLNATTTDPLDYTEVGTYVITWTYDDGNGNTTTQTQNVTVEESPINAVTFDDAEFVYNGTVQSINVNNLPTGATVTYTTSPETGNDNGAVNAGVYTVTAVVMPQPEAFNCAPVTLTATITIDRATQTITFDAIPVKNLETDVDFQLDATASSGLEVYYTYTYTSPDPAADVSSTGWVTLLTSGEITITAHQDGNENYLPAQEVEQPLIIESSDASIFTMVVGDVTYDTPQSNIYHLIDCGDNSDSVEVTIVTEVGATVQPGHTFIIQTPQPGIYTATVTVTSEDGISTETYTVTVERRFDFSDIVVQKFDNVLLVNNNPQNNGGYEFTAYEWYRNGQLVSTEQYYSAGNNSGDMLDPDAEYMVKVTTAQGEVLQTCLGQIFLQHVNSARLYPNPVAFGQKLTIEADLPAIELENMTIAVYTLNGALVKEVKSSSRITEIDAPMEEAVYIVMLKSANYSKTFKVIVR